MGTRRLSDIRSRMGQGDSPYQSGSPEGPLVPGFGARELSSLPLLPYERQLADAIGVTIEEYKEFRIEVLKRAGERGPEYAHIPDVDCDLITIGITLAVGIALSAAAELLTPDPPKIEERKNNQVIELESSEGRRRFNNTQGFSGVQGLTTLGTVIPVTFGRYFQGSDGENYGGIYVSPSLIWSRMFSYGGHEGFKGLYMIGEVTIDTTVERDKAYNVPLQGISIGDAPLQGLHESQYAFYFKSTRPSGRTVAADLVWGTRGFPPTGDPETGNDIFTSPTNEGDNAPAFCMSYIPSNNNQVGCYATIENATAFRTNFEIIPYQQLDGKDDPTGIIVSERTMIAGEYGVDRESGMRGVGRGYSPLMGIVSLRGVEPEGALVKQDVNIGDDCVFRIRGKEYTEDDLKIQDKHVAQVNSSINSMREAADDALQIGESFMLGRTVWQVIRREGGTNGIWEAGGPSLNITLRMREHTGGPATQQIGVAGRAGLGYRRNAESSATGVTSEGNPATFSKETGWIGTEFWNLSKFALGVVRNQRPAAVTEIGFKSQVWQRLDNLCNFPSLVSPKELEEADNNEEVTLRSGTANKYIKRTSVFALLMRPVNLEASDEEAPWQGTNMRFCVTGSSPVDQFNAIRIKSMGEPRQMEFRFVPKNGTDVGQYSPDNEVIYRMNAKTGTRVGTTVNVGGVGNFEITTVGDVVTAASIAFNKELSTGGREAKTELLNVPTAVSFLFNQPQFRGEIQTYCCQLFGPAVPGQYSREFFAYPADSNARNVRIQLTVVGVPAPAAFQQYWNRQWAWQVVQWAPNPTTAVGSFQPGEQVARAFRNAALNSEARYFNDRNNAGGDIALFFSITSVRTQTITIPAEAARIFEFKSQYGDVSHYKEISRSCDTGPEHVISYVNESVQPLVVPQYPMTTCGLAVRSSRQISRVSQLNVWMPDGVRVDRLLTGDEGPSNLFSDLIYYFLVNKNGGLGNITNERWVDEESFRNTAGFLQANKLFFDGAVEQKVNLREFASSLAPYFLCNFVIAAGQFAMTPALPFNNGGQIDPGAVNIAATFNKGNIIEDSFTLTYINRSERLPAKAIVNYRVNPKYKAPYTASAVVRENIDDAVQYPEESYDMTQFCTSREHAILAAKYIIAVKRLVDHSVTFQTLPTGLALAPGQYIRLYSEDMPYNGGGIGAVSNTDGTVVSATPIEDGVHSVSLYNRQDPDIKEVELEIQDGKVVDPQFRGSLFSTWVPAKLSSVYLVEELNLDEEGLVNITASHFPMDQGGTRSAIAELILNDGAWFVSDSVEA